MTFNFKEAFEGHPIIFGITLLATGFASGFGMRSYVLPIPASPPACIIEGLPSLEQSFEKQISSLNSQLVSSEAKASDHLLLTAYQDAHKKSADRLREDIGRVHANHLLALDKLTKRCN